MYECATTLFVTKVPVHFNDKRVCCCYPCYMICVSVICNNMGLVGGPAVFVTKVRINLLAKKWTVAQSHAIALSHSQNKNKHIWHVAQKQALEDNAGQGSLLYKNLVKDLVTLEKLEKSKNQSLD